MRFKLNIATIRRVAEAASLLSLAIGLAFFTTRDLIWGPQIDPFYPIPSGRPSKAQAPSQPAPRATPSPVSNSGSGLRYLRLPVPQPSAMSDMTGWRSFKRDKSLGDVARELAIILGRAGYECSFYGAPNGFAVVTPMERIHPSSRPFEGDARWELEAQGLIDFSDFTVDYLRRALIHADPGHYQIMVFVVTNVPVTNTGRGMPLVTARTLELNGSASLPRDFESLPFDGSYRITALVYEFNRPSVGKEAQLSIPSAVPGFLHLQRAGLIDDWIQ